MMILNRLKAETKNAHQALEKLMIPRIKAANNSKDYIRLLEIFYGYFKPVESNIDAYLTEEHVPHYDMRRKSDIIVKDIKIIGGNDTPLLICDDVPEINNVNQAIGAMYVLEGSTLGGQIISKMLRNNLGIATTEGIEFFGGYGEDTEKMWSSFTNSINARPLNAPAEAEIVKTANETFTKFKTWIENNQ